MPKKLRLGLSVFCILSVVYFAITRIPRSWRSILLEVPVITHANEVKPDWHLRLFCAAILIVFWTSIYFFIRKHLRRRRGAPNAISWVFGNLGLGVALALYADMLLSRWLNGWVTKSLVLLPLLVSLHSLWKFPYKPYLYYRAKRPSPALRTAALLAALVLVIRVASQFWYSIYLKPTGTWDEALSWWPGVELMNNFGLPYYLQNFKFNNYDPAYFLMVPAILFPASQTAWIDAASNFAGLFFGLATLVLLLEQMNRGRHAWKNFLLCFVLYATVVLSQGGWLPVLQWRPGNGDGLAALLCTLFFLHMYRARTIARNDLPLWLYSSFGIGILLQTTKPPLSTLFLYADIAFLGIAYFQLWLSRRSAFSTLAVGLAFFLGALLGKILWWLTLLRHKMHGVYDFNLSVFLHPQFTVYTQRVIGLFSTDYKVQFLIFGLFGLLALLRPKQRRLLPQFAMACGFIAAIVWLYFSFWNTTEHESAGRYFSHTLLAWIWIFMIAERRLILASLKLTTRLVFGPRK